MILYIQLFLTFLKIGAFSFGGGYAAIPLIEAQVIDRFGWLTFSDFSDLVTIAEMTPGPIAINSATFVGNQVAGIPGALIATLGVILPSCIFVTLLAYLYNKYRTISLMQGILTHLRPAVVATIFAAGLSILIPALFENGMISLEEGNFRLRYFVYFAVAFFLLRKTHINAILVMVGCGCAEALFRLLAK